MDKVIDVDFTSEGSMLPSKEYGRRGEILLLSSEANYRMEVEPLGISSPMDVMKVVFLIAWKII